MAKKNQQEPKELLTEQQWIAKMKKNGLELYNTKDLKPKLKAFYAIEAAIVKTLEHNA